MNKKLPIGIQTFSEIIDKGYVYIDKTGHAVNLADNYKYVFLSRPRRFGKSLFLDTLHSLFEGRKELFKGLYAYTNWNWSKKYPVIKISWAGDFSSLHSTKNVIASVLQDNQERLGVECSNREQYDICFKELIRKTSQKYNSQVVILIDEYDKPILDAIKDPQVAGDNRNLLRSLYVMMKDSDQYIRFAFLTGVSKFSKASIFSGLNNLTDISLNKKYATVCGYTQNDIETVFKSYLSGVDFDKLRLWYNGYNFLGESVYNPFDILLFISNDFIYRNYWFESGTPKFLIELIKKNNYFLPNLSNLKVVEDLVGSFDIEDIKFETVLFQGGYLTIDKIEIDDEDDITYLLKVPNREVQISLNRFFVNQLCRDYNVDVKQTISKSLKNVDINKFKTALTSLFASIPYNNYTNNEMQRYEGYYASVIYTYLASLGFRIIGEDVTSRGRIDLTVFVNDIIYIIEFKVGSEDALLQIKNKGYAEKYKGNGKKIVLIGINFDEKRKNVSSIKWEQV